MEIPAVDDQKLGLIIGFGRIPAAMRADIRRTIDASSGSWPSVTEVHSRLALGGARARTVHAAWSGACGSRQVRTEIDRVRELGLSVLLLGGPGYPTLLAAIADPPLALFVAGDEPMSGPCVAIVGSRRASPYGTAVAHTLGADIARAGIAVASGLALGVDGAAHRGALSGGASTWAVLGHGHGHVYPRAHAPLAKQIVAQGGALVSEYSPSVGPRRHHFPERNRIISGLALGVVVVEAAAASGSLITAQLGLDQGREIMAVPGSVGSARSGGCHQLIREGAALVECATDVLETLDLSQSAARTPSNEVPLSERAATVLERVGFEVSSVDAIALAVGMTVCDVMGVLTELELDGFVAAYGDGYIRRP